MDNPHFRFERSALRVRGLPPQDHKFWQLGNERVVLSLLRLGSDSEWCIYGPSGVLGDIGVLTMKGSSDGRWEEILSLYIHSAPCPPKRRSIHVLGPEI